MIAQCKTNSINFQDLGFKKVVADFNGGMISSDAGGLLLREINKRFNIIDRFARCFIDRRDSRRIEHSLETLLAQRIFGICLGYEDLNDHEELRKDRLFAVLCDHKDPKGEKRQQLRDRGNALAGKSTLNRLETAGADINGNHRYKKIFYDENKIDDFLVKIFQDTYGEVPDRIILDLDTTDDIIHGTQEGRFFHAHYDDYCYLPLYIYCGNHLLSVKLRTSNVDPGNESVEDVKRVIARIRKRWPEVKILLRGDSGFCRDILMSWCDGNNTDYLLGLAPNSRLLGYIEKQRAEVKKKYEQTKRKVKVYKNFYYKTNRSWSRKRRVVGKAEYNELGKNNRFVVTTLSVREIDKRALYEDIYCARGDMENRIKEQKLDLFSDRTSSHTMHANQLRLYFAALAYIILNLLRQYGLAATDSSTAYCSTIRLRFLKIGARIKITYRRIVISFAEGYSWKDDFVKILRAILIRV